MTKQQRRTARKELIAYGKRQRGLPGDSQNREGWEKAIRDMMDYYAKADPQTAQLVELRYLQGLEELEVIGRLYIGRTTYYRKAEDAISTLAVYAAHEWLV